MFWIIKIESALQHFYRDTGFRADLIKVHPLIMVTLVEEDKEVTFQYLEHGDPNNTSNLTIKKFKGIPIEEDPHVSSVEVFSSQRDRLLQHTQERLRQL